MMYGNYPAKRQALEVRLERLMALSRADRPDAYKFYLRAKMVRCALDYRTHEQIRTLHSYRQYLSAVDA